MPQSDHLLKTLPVAIVAAIVVLACPVVGAPATAAPRAVDPQLLRSKGIRQLAGQHLTLYTDLPAGAAVDGLPQVFDQAFTQWCRYFSVDATKHADWHLTGYLMKDKERFAAAGLLPDELPSFLHGYAVGREFWLYEQPSDYYRRHLVLHEGTHAFMNTLLGGCGPPWYMEGMAELLATHRWQEGRLALGVFPDNRQDFLYWGRIKLMQDAGQSQPLALAEVLALPPRAFLENEAYGWSWGAAAFLDGHPRYRERFRQLPRLVAHGDFNAEARQLFAADWGELDAEWRLFVSDVDYGYDLARAVVTFADSAALPAQGATVSIAADRDWQSSGYRIEAGKTYRLRASGRYQVADVPKPWWCEPGGVSIHYYRGRPLGQLLAAVYFRDAQPSAGFSPFEPVPIGLGTTFTPRESGTLYFKINESPAKLADNQGTLEVEVVAE